MNHRAYALLLALGEQRHQVVDVAVNAADATAYPPQQTEDDG